MLSILAALALLGGIGVSSPATAPAYEVAHVSASNQVVAAVEPFPNYVFHLLAVARVGFDSDYANRYRDTVPPDDLATLQRHRHLLEWESGDTGALTPIFVFFPAYMNLERPDDCAEYYGLVAAGAKAGSSA
jgi:hypothetical protein